MPSALREWLGRGRRPPWAGRGSPGMRALLGYFRRATPRGRHRFLALLLGREPFSLALVVATEETADGSRVEILAGGSGRPDLIRMRESLGGRSSPLAGLEPRGFRWIDLQSDPFGPGTGFLRKFGLRTALVLPLGRAPAGGTIVLLLGAARPLERDDSRVREVLNAWSIHDAVSGPEWRRRLELECEREAGSWPGLALWDAVPAALAVVARDEVVAVNREGEELLGGAVGESGRGWRLWLAAAVRRLEVAGRRREVLAAGPGRARSLEVRLGPRLEQSEGRVVAVRDATREATAEDRRVEAVSTLSHELRTPLTSLKSAVDLLLRGDAGALSERQERFLALAMRSLDRMERLVGDLLDVSRAAAGRLVLKRERIDLGRLVHESLEMLAATARSRDVELSGAGVPESFGAHVDGDKVVQMVHNTVGNALKYTDPGGRVRIGLQAEGRNLPPAATALAERFFLPARFLTLEVEDSGMGMSEEARRQLFGRFQRGPEAESGPEAGHGLGLHITRALVEAHGGIIRVGSAPGAGTTVEITLPRDPETARLLAGARGLEEALARGGRLAFLDVRRPDRPPRPPECAAATALLASFVARLGGGDRAPAAAGDPEGGRRVGAGTAGGGRLHELADGLWAAVLPSPERLTVAWEVEKARPGLPEILAGSRWQVDPPAARGRQKGAETAPEGVESVSR